SSERSAPVLVAHPGGPGAMGSGCAAPWDRLGLRDGKAGWRATLPVHAAERERAPGLRAVDSYFTRWRTRDQTRAAPLRVRFVLESVLSSYIRWGELTHARCRNRDCHLQFR